MFDLNYQLTFDDYQIFLQELRRRRKKRLSKRNIYLGVGLIAFLALLATVTSSWSALFSWDTLSTLLVIAIVYAIFMRFLVPKMWRARFDAEKIGASPVMLHADDSELRIVQNDVESRVAWHRLEDLTHTENHTFLWLSQVQSMIIPHRAFADAKQQQAFAGFVAGRMDVTGGNKIV